MEKVIKNTIVTKTFISRSVAGYEKIIKLSAITSICRNKKELQIETISGTVFYLDFDSEAEAEAIVDSVRYYL